MQVIIEKPDHRPYVPHRLMLFPETDRDQKVLKRLRACYELTNYGRVAERDEIYHIGVQLTPKAL